ncbi:hypothetical protein GCM10011613_33100 [Cellvibrio zantedeschiae]|uniref:Uncharacterized protein n=1 Tax=Cellvibrio zantedeschiae TaxID=1237077 RepID=A0ABQ3BC34_9GAMM|nr:hypothetical protein [Cellvibrio zantedeschiae]GGY85350.1 hypothetical protein GCM10011613_33100 [Cellvibrio zantedeschiae]
MEELLDMELAAALLIIELELLDIFDEALLDIELEITLFATELTLLE